MLIVEEHNHREQREREERLAVAWRNAVWRRAKKMPSLQKVIEESRKRQPTASEIVKKQQTPEQMFAQVKRMHAKFNKREG